MSFPKMHAHLRRTRTSFPIGVVAQLASEQIVITGLQAHAMIGECVTILGPRPVTAQVVSVSDSGITVIPEHSTKGIKTGQPARLNPPNTFAPDTSWIGRVIDPMGRPLDGRPLLPALAERAIDAPPPRANERRAMGERLSTGLAAMDTLLPLVRGQRIGLMAGSGVGKSTLLGDLALGVDADVVVIGLVGERGREVRHFVEHILGQSGLSRAVVVAATSDTSPQLRRACAGAATAVAETFRDDGRHVLLLIDSVTRFAEAHREIATSSDASPNARGFPSSTNTLIARLCERAGPGTANQGDITAIYSVLVAGSDMDEPIADMLRGVLDGHIVLERDIAERGRFPAIDVVRSVSRSLPAAASPQENLLIGQARSLMADYEQSKLMIQAGLYVPGNDPKIDAAVLAHDALERFLTHRKTGSIGASFSLLRQAVNAAKPRDS